MNVGAWAQHDNFILSHIDFVKIMQNVMRCELALGWIHCIANKWCSGNSAKDASNSAINVLVGVWSGYTHSQLGMHNSTM